MSKLVLVVILILSKAFILSERNIRRWGFKAPTKELFFYNKQQVFSGISFIKSEAFICDFRQCKLLSEYHQRGTTAAGLMCLCRSIMCEREKHLTNCRQHRRISMHRAEQHPIFFSSLLPLGPKMRMRRRRRRRRMWVTAVKCRDCKNRSNRNTRDGPATLWVHCQTCEETLSALHLMRKTRRLSLCGNYREGGG